MRKILDKLIAELDRKLTEARQNNPLDDSVKGWFMFGNHRITYIFDEDECFLEVYNPKRDVFLPNVENYCSTKCIYWSQIDVGEEPSEYDLNGFRDEADYMRYRCG